MSLPVRVLLFLAKRHLARGRPTSARRVLELCLQRDPANARANDLLTQVRDALGVTQAAPEPVGGTLARPRLDFRVGQVLHGALTGITWRVDQRIDSGAMGVVFLVANMSVRDNPPCALKTYQALYAENRSVRRRFQREAVAWIRLGAHPNIVEAYWAEECDGTLCVVMEYVPGGNLRSIIGRGLPIQRVLQLALNLCDALHYAHEGLQLIHRDVKSANCLIGSDGALKLSDFGISTTMSVGAAQESETTALERRARVGSYPYQAPEQRASIAPDQRADIYAFGITVAEMLLGRALEGSAIRRDCDSGRLTGPIWELVHRCVQEDRALRPLTHADVRRELEACFVALLRMPAPGAPTPPRATLAMLQDRAAAYLALGAYAEAIDSYRRALEGAPELAFLWAGLAAAHVRAGNYESAVAAADRGLALGRQTSHLLNNKGLALAKVRRPAEARSCYEAALRFDPANAMLLFNLADVQCDEGESEAALRTCERAVAANPRLVRALVLKASIEADIERVDAAQATLESALSIDPCDVDALLGLARVIQRMGRSAEALEHVDRALAVGGRSGGAVRLRAWLLLQTRRLAEAIESFDEALAETPEDVETMRGKCLALLTLGRRDDARDVIARASALEPLNVPVQQAARLVDEAGDA